MTRPLGIVVALVFLVVWLAARGDVRPLAKVLPFPPAR